MTHLLSTKFKYGPVTLDDNGIIVSAGQSYKEWVGSNINKVIDHYKHKTYKPRLIPVKES